MNIMMKLVSLYKSQSLTLLIKYPAFPNLYLPRPIFHSYTTKIIVPTDIDSLDFKISFLKNKCGLSGKALYNVSNCLHFDSSDQRPDLVLDLFRSFGFPLSSITKIISTCPRVLKDIHPQKLIRPKLDFLLSISKFQQEVVAIVTKNPHFLSRSLTNHLIPSLNLLNSITGCYTNTIAVLKCNPYIIGYDLSKNLLLNTEFLIRLGVPHSQILKLLKNGGSVLVQPHDKVRNAVVKVTDMGFDFFSSYFLTAIYTLCIVSDLTWESKCVLLRSFGFSDNEILSMFKKLPLVMCHSEKNIKEKMEFFLNKLQWTPFRLSSYPSVLPYSLEKRTIPRCSVLQVLVMKNITSESYMLSSILSLPDKKFFEDFVAEHKDEVPEVIEAYQGKLRFDKYTFKQKGQLSLTRG